MTTSVASTAKSSLVPSPNGGPLQPSEQAVAVPSTPTGLDCSPETVKVLVAMLHGLFYNTLSGDVMFLSLLQAKDTAMESGVSEAEFERVAGLVMKNWKLNRDRNPLSCLF